MNHPLLNEEKFNRARELISKGTHTVEEVAGIMRATNVFTTMSIWWELVVGKHEYLLKIHPHIGGYLVDLVIREREGAELGAFYTMMRERDQRELIRSIEERNRRQCPSCNPRQG
jgi:hypothetical protein